MINKEYFNGEILIPNLFSLGSGASAFVSKANEDLLIWFIQKYEKMFLIKLLGVKMYNEFVIAPDLDLKSKLIDDVSRQSPIAYYVYYWFVRNRITETVGIGEIQGQSDNSTVVSPSEKMIKAWNNMVDDVNNIVYWIKCNKCDYPSFSPDLSSDIFFKINTLGI
ncbi:MAG: hypothetical protein RR137_08990 [Odoribacter sp.]